MSLQSHKAGTQFGKPNNQGKGMTAEQWGVLIVQIARKKGINPTGTFVAQALGTIDAEGGFDGSSWAGISGHIGPWAEESSFGSEADRLDPVKSTEAAFDRYKADGNSFYQGWWKWEGREEDGTGQERAPKFQQVAEAAIINSGRVGGGENQLEPLKGAKESALKDIHSAEDFLTEALHTLTDFRALGQLAAEAFSWFLKLLAKAIWDYVIAPLVHWSERAVSFYWINFFGEGVENGSGIGYQLRNNAGTITILFWSLGYATLWSDGTSTDLVLPHESLLGQGIKGIEGAIARRNLIAPAKVKEKTPTKPTPRISRVPVETQNTYSVARNRPVKVENQQRQLEGRSNGSDRGRFTPAPVPRPGKKASGQLRGGKVQKQLSAGPPSATEKTSGKTPKKVNPSKSRNARVGT